MASVAERKRKHRAAVPARKAQAKAKPELTLIQGGQTKPKAEKPETGLQWMEGTGKIGREAVAAGKRYGLAYRLAGIDGLNPLRSCLNDEPRGGGGAGLPPAVAECAAREELEAARTALAHHTALVLACDMVCGRGWKPWDLVRERKGKQKDGERLIGDLQIALHLLVKHYREADRRQG